MNLAAGMYLGRKEGGLHVEEQPQHMLPIDDDDEIGTNVTNIVLSS